MAYENDLIKLKIIKKGINLLERNFIDPRWCLEDAGSGGCEDLCPSFGVPGCEQRYW